MRLCRLAFSGLQLHGFKVNIVSAMVDCLPHGVRHVVREAGPPNRWQSTAYCHLNVRPGPRL